jgi:hypothetical protein
MSLLRLKCATPQAEEFMSTGTHTNVKEALDHVRAAGQELHAAINDAAAKQSGATKADLEAFAQKAKSVAQSLKSSISTQEGAARKALTEAASELETSQKQAIEGLKASGEAFQNSMREAVRGARASVQKINEAVAAARSKAS